MLSGMKLEREGSLRTFDTEKEELLESLRSAAVRADSLPSGAAKEKAEREAREKDEREEKEKAEREAKEKEQQRVEREKKREREPWGEYNKYTSRVADIQIVAKPQSEREARLLSEARSPSFRDREREGRLLSEARSPSFRDRERDRDGFGGGSRKSIGIRDGGYRYTGGDGGAAPVSSPITRGPAPIRASMRPYDRDARDPRDARPREDGTPSGPSIRHGPSGSGYGGSFRDARGSRDGPGSFVRYGSGSHRGGADRGRSRGR